MDAALRRQTLADVLHRSAKRHPGKTAIICGTTQWSYAAFDAVCDRVAAGLGKAAVGAAAGAFGASWAFLHAAPPRSANVAQSAKGALRILIDDYLSSRGNSPRGRTSVALTMGRSNELSITQETARARPRPCCRCASRGSERRRRIGASERGKRE